MTMLKRNQPNYFRQGACAFIPAPWLRVKDTQMKHQHTVADGYVAELAVVVPGETVYVCSQYPYGLRELDYKRVLRSDPKTARLAWRLSRREARLYVKGAVRHSSHGTIVLPGWYRVIAHS